MVYMHDFLHLRQRLHHTVLMIRVYLVLSANRVCEGSAAASVLLLYTRQIIIVVGGGHVNIITVQPDLKLDPCETVSV